MRGIGDPARWIGNSSSSVADAGGDHVAPTRSRSESASNGARTLTSLSK